MSDSNDDTDDTMGSGASNDGGSSPPKVASQSRNQMSVKAGSSQALHTKQPSRQGSSAISRQLTRSFSNAASLRSADHASRASIGYSTSQNKFIDGFERPMVNVSKAGFSIQNITIMEGQTVTFIWEEQTTEILNVVQVVHDGEKLRPVVGGFSLEQPESQREKEQKFNMEGDFKFVLAGLRCTPLNVNVRPRMELLADVADTGFSPEYIEIDQFHCIKWQWKQTSVPHSVQAVTHCMKHGGFYKEPAHSASVVGTMSGSYRHMFLQPGLYYFQTESTDLGRHHLCIVYVKECQREQKIEVLDRSFQPMILLIEEGDRVWWSWDKNKCKKPHSVYQMAAPNNDHNPDDPYEAVKDGFKWSTPSKQGLMSHEFFKPGVYFFSDQNFQEAAEYIGTIIVKPRQKVQDIEITRNGFVPDVMYAQTGDRIWWVWNPEVADTSDSFSIIEVEKCLNPVARKSELMDCEDQCQLMDDATTHMCVKIGLATAFYPTIGVYQYKLTNSAGILSSCAVLINPGPKNYTVHITDNGFEPKVITVRPNDRVWWVWQSGRKQHNVTQVSHQGLPIEDGFCSGAVRDCPSAFMNQFYSCGVFYFMSASLPKIFGAVVVSTQPSVHEVNVTSTEIQPDPIVVNVNDIVCWMYKGLRSFDVSELTAIDQVLDPDFGCDSISPRRCMSRIVSRSGLLHFYSKSFQKSKDKNSQETRLSSIVSDNRYDNEVIRISKSGFYPSSLHVQKGQSVLWTWKEAGDEEHNVIHVKPSQGEEPLEIIQGVKSFNSGKPVAKNSFLYTFDEIGQFTIASQGAPGYRSLVSVVNVASRTLQPYISSELNGGTVDRHTQIQLSCDVLDSLIYYTVNGSIPHLHSTTVKLYQPEKGVILKKSGLVVIRAMSVAKEQLHSHVFTSKRFWVLSKDDENSEDEDAQSAVNSGHVAAMPPDNSTSWKWWNCVPTVRGCFSSSGRMEIFWDPPAEDSIPLIQGYQLYLNGVCYCEMFPTTNNSVSISSLAGGRLYEVVVEVFPLNEKYTSLKSNNLLMKCPIVTSDNGPIISLERTEEKDSIAIVWMAMSTPELPVVGYLLFLNDQQCGQRLVPDAESNRCKVVIDGCDMSNGYKIYVVALPKDISEEPKMSNILQVKLPLDTSQICLPPPDQRLEDDELYQEYLEIHEGSGYLPEMDENPQLSADDAKRRASVTFQTVIKDSGTKDDRQQDGVPYKSDKILPHALVEVEQDSEPKAFNQDYDSIGSEDDLFLPSAIKNQSRRKGHLSKHLKRAVGTMSLLKGQRHGNRSDLDMEDLRSSPSFGKSNEYPRSSISMAEKHMSRANTRENLSSMHNILAEDDSVQRGGLKANTVKRKVTFFAIALAVRNFLRQERILQECITPGYKKTIVNWSRMKNFLSAAAAFQGASSKTKTFKLNAGNVSTPVIGPLGVYEARDPRRLDKLFQYHRMFQVTQSVDRWSPEVYDQSVITGDNERSTHSKRRQILNQAKMQQRSLYKANQKASMEQDSDSESSGSSWDSETDSENHDYVVIDARHPAEFNRSKKARKNTAGHRRERKRAHDRVMVEVDNSSGRDYSSTQKGMEHHSTKHHGKHKRSKGCAIIEVQETVELDLQKLPGHNGDLDTPIRKMLSVPAKSAMVRVDEGQFIVSDGEGILPAPSVLIENRGANRIKIQWELPQKPDPDYNLLMYVVNVVGVRFLADVNSDLSFECNIVEKDEEMRGVQHCWNIAGKERCHVNGLVPGLTYRVYVIANYTLLHGEQPSEIQTSSSVMYYTTVGPPKPPKLKVSSVDLYQVCAEWDIPELHGSVQLKGFLIFIDGKQLGGLRNNRVLQMMINNMVPGKTISVSISAVMKQAIADSEPSKLVHLTCPARPPAPVVYQQPSYKRGCLLIGWERPQGHTYSSNEEDISLYSVFMDGKWYGEIRSNPSNNKHGYQFFLTDLPSGQSIDINVKAIAGSKRIYPSSYHVYTLSDSPMSNTLSLMAPASPMSPLLRLDGLHPDGIDVTWQVPQQFGDVTLSGYQLLKNGKLYGSIIPPDVCNLRIKDITLGEKLMLQLIALTDHPVGKGDHRTVEDKDSGIDGSSQHDDKDCFASDKYGGCKPGAHLTVHYTGLVQPPSQVWSEKVTGHSALVVWNKDLQPKAHFVKPTSYQVTWWPGDKPKDNINSDSTTGDHLWITNLHPATTYTVTVEARKMEKYIDFDEDSTENDVDNFSAFILTSQSGQLTLQTASPPEAPQNIGVLATTCHSIRLGWDHPQEHGVEVTGLRVDCKPVESHMAQRVHLDLMPDATSTVIENLEERTEYVIHITAVTDEYFDHLSDNHKLRKNRVLPKEMSVIPEDSVWLPTATILAKTSGTDPPANLHILMATTGSLTLSWTPPVVHGSNKLLGVVVRWSDLKQAKPKEEDFVVARHVNLLPREDTLTLKDLLPGTQYKIVAEAVVSVKSSLDEEKWNGGIAKNRRTTHVMSKPLIARTKAPCEAPRPLLTSFTQNTASLYWEKPLLVSVIGKDEDGKPKYLRRYLEGYKLEINGKLHCALGPSEQSCTLTKCKPGKPYQVDLVALTCTDDMRKERKANQLKPAYKRSHPQMSQDYTLILGDDDTLDSSTSDNLEISLPKKQEGYLASMTGRYEYGDNKDNQPCGDVIVEWTIQGSSNLLRQFNVIWYCHEDKVVQTKYVGPDQRKCTIPVTRNKAVYEVTVEPTYNTDVISQPPQSIQILIPGPPDAPQIFLHSVEAEEFIIEWGEPRLYAGVQIKAYQLYMNEKKAGNELSSSHRKAVIPCRPNRQYTISLLALSCSSEIADSPMSNTLLVNTASTSPRLQGAFGLEEWSALTDDQEIPLKVTMVTGSAIHLDWSAFLGPSDVACYRVQWSSVAQPTQREVRVSSKDSNCVISKCLPGTTHFVRIVAVDQLGEILEKSKQLTIQTSAPPDSPILSVRACNFRYIAIQWDMPNQYGDCLVTGYKVFVNDIVEAILNADQLSFTFTHGKSCQEYSFQVQALTGHDNMQSKPSDALLVTWPGVIAPVVRRIPTVSGSVLRLGWEEPFHTEGVTIKHFRLCCYEEGTEKLVQSIGPIHPETHEAEFRNLKKGNYVVFLEVYIYGTSDVIRSEPLRMQPAIAPEPPHISATVIGLEERRLIEKITCELVNKRDRLIRKVGHKIKKIGALNYPMRAEKDEEILLGAMMLSNVDEMLGDCFNALSQHTGQLLIHVSWQSIQSNPDICVSGFQALVNGKQYGNPVHPGIKHIRLKLNLEEPSHKLAMVATSEKPQAVSEESNSVELLTEPFQPFSFYCYHSIHSKDSQWPSRGCCQYQDSIMFERQQAKKLANQGLLKKRVPPPACSLLDVFDGEYKPLDWKYKKNLPTAMFFWTPWCLASKKMMNNFVRFAREFSREYAFIAIACGMKGTSLTERQELIHNITKNSWREDGVIWHCTSKCASSITEATNNIRRSAVGRHSRLNHDAGYDSEMDLTELLGIAGVPTFLFLREDGCIAWHGRYCAYDYNNFASFMRHSFSDVLDVPCTVYNCDCCKNDMEINRDAIDELVHIKSLNGSTNLLHQSGSAIQVTTDPQYNAIISTPHNGGYRDTYPAHHSGHRDLYPGHSSGHRDIYPTHEILVFSRENSPNRKAKKEDKISINIRPFSASPPSSSLTSPYLQRLTPKRRGRRPRSRKTVYY